MPATSVDAISIVDCHYLLEGRAAAYLMIDGGEAAFFDNGTRFSVPYLLEELAAKDMRPEEVRYIVVTHVHLDHCGGTAELAKHCPNATILAHPRAGRHIADPRRLVAGATEIYGAQRLLEIYGVVEPVDEARIRTLEDESVVELGTRSLRFLHTPGHAKHHFAIHDATSNSVIAGDAFGLTYRQLDRDGKCYVGYVCSPPEFDPAAGKQSIRRILDTGAERVFVTHFGEFSRLREGAEQLARSLDNYDAAVNEAADGELTGQPLEDWCRECAESIIVAELRRSGLDPEDKEVAFWAKTELMVSSKGLAFLATRRRAPAP